MTEVQGMTTGAGMRTKTVLAGLRGRIRSATIIDGLAASILAFGAFSIISYGADRLLELERFVRVILALGAVAWIGRRLQLRLFRPFSEPLADDELALALERRGHLQQRVISTVQFARLLGDAGRPSRGESEPMMRAVIDETESRTKELADTSAVDSGRVAKSFATIAVVAAALTTLAARFPEEASLWARRNLLFQSAEWPRETSLFFVGVQDGVLQVPVGIDVTLTARAEGVIPDSVRYEVVFTDDSEVEVAAGRTPDGIFRGTLRAPVRDARIIARGGDGRSESIELRLLRRPELTEFVIETTLPDYLGDSGPAPVPLGTAEVVRGGSVQVFVRTDKPLESVSLLEDEAPVEVTERFERETELGADGSSASVSFRPDRDLDLRLLVIDAQGVEPETAPTLQIRVVEDEVPTVQFEPRGIGPAIVSDARIPGRLVTTDDHGVQSLSFTAVVTTPAAAAQPGAEPGEPIERALHKGGNTERPLLAQGLSLLQVGAAESTLDLVVDLIDLPEADRPKPGATLRLGFSAQDAREGEVGRGASEQRAFRIVTRDELIEELDRRQTQLRREVESVLADTVELASAVADLKVEEPAAASRPARRTPALGERCRGISGRFRDVLDELSNNRLLEQRDVDRLDQNVVRALRGIATGPFQRAATALATFGGEPSDDLRKTALEQLDRAQSDLRAVLSRMKDGEGLARLVEILRSVLRTTERVESETEAARRRQAASSIFGTKPPGGQQNGGRDR